MTPLIRILIIFVLVIRSAAIGSLAAPDSSRRIVAANLSQAPLIALDDEDDWDDEWDEDEDDEWFDDEDDEWFDEEDDEWFDDEEEDDYQAPRAQPKDAVKLKPIESKSAVKQEKTKQATKKPKEEEPDVIVAKPAEEPAAEPGLVLDRDSQKLLENALKQTSVITDNETISALFNRYGDELKGLNPNNPKDLKEINKFLEIVGAPRTKPIKRTATVIRKDDPVLNFSARNISVRDAFATLARISGKSITVSGSIQDRDTISVIEINDEPFTQAFFSMVQAAGVDFTVSGDNYTILKRTGSGKTKIFALEPTEVDTSLPVLERVADLSYDNVDLNTIIKDLTNKYGIDIIMTAAPTERVTVRVRGVNVEDALKLILSGSAFDYTKTGDRFIIYSKVNMNFGLDSKVVLFPIKHLEAKNITNLLPQQLKGLVQVAEEQNALIAEGSKEDLTRLYQFLRAVDKPINQVELDVKLVETSKTFNQNRSLIAEQFVFGRFGASTNDSQIASGSAGSTATGTDTGGIVSPVLPGDPNATTATSTATGAATTAASTVANAALGSVFNRGNGEGIDFIRITPRDINLFAGRPSVDQNRTIAKVKADQRLFVASGKTAKLSFDQDRNIPLNTGQAQGQLGVVQNQSISRITAGTSLDITPVVGDNGVITLKLEVEVSENSDATVGDTNVPAATTRRRISTELQAFNHETIAVGGLFQDRDSISGAEIPFLGNIPIIGNFFGNKSKADTNLELVVLITPHVKTTGGSGLDDEVYVRAEASNY